MVEVDPYDEQGLEVRKPHGPWINHMPLPKVSDEYRRTTTAENEAFEQRMRALYIANDINEGQRRRLISERTKRGVVNDVLMVTGWVIMVLGIVFYRNYFH